MRDEVKLSQEDLEGIRQRMDVVSYAVLAEVSHFQRQKVHDFNAAMHDFLGGQISFYEEVCVASKTPTMLWCHLCY